MALCFLLDLGHGSDVAGLDVVLELCDLLAQLVDGDLLVLYHAHELQLVDAITHRDKFVCEKKK